MNRRAAALRADGHRVISLGQAVPFFGPPEAALDAARAAIGTPELNRYATDPGLPSLRRALAARLGVTLGTTVTADDLVMTAGGNHAFALALTTLVSPGDDVILPAPYFTNHQMMVCAMGARAVEAPVADRERFAVRWSDIAPHLTPRTRAIVLCNPSNPTGAPVRPEDGRQIIDEAASRGLVVISDETYLHFVYEGSHWSAASVPGWRDTVAVIGTFSKSFGMMGWRLGFLLADAAVCEQAVKVQDAMIICAPVIAQVLGEAAVTEAWDHAVTFHPALRERRQVLMDGLAAMPRAHWEPQAGGLFAFVRIEGCDDSTALSHRLLEDAHVVTIPGIAFGESGEGCLRLSYGFATPQEIGEAMDRIRALL